MTHISYRSTFPWIPDILEREELIRISDEIIAAYNKLRRLRRLTQVYAGLRRYTQVYAGLLNEIRRFLKTHTQVHLTIRRYTQVC